MVIKMGNLYFTCGDYISNSKGMDAIVNAANNYLKEGSGVCGAIFKSANSNKLQEECSKIRYCKTGQAVITKGYNLNAKYIIHTVGPVYKDGKQENILFKNMYEDTEETVYVTSIIFEPEPEFDENKSTDKHVYNKEDVEYVQLIIE